MAHSRYLRQMARSLRVEQQLTVDELALRMALPRSTIYYWVRDLPLRSGSSQEPALHRASPISSEAAYAEALESFEELDAQPTFRDFVCVYLVQGEQRDRTRVALTNSDPMVMRLASRWIKRLTDKAPFLSLQCSGEQSLTDLRRFWSEAVGAEPRTIRVRDAAGPKRSDADGDDRVPGAPPRDDRHGLLTVTVADTLLRARLQAWMQRTRETWR
jgi:transposase-like protein